MRTTHEIPAIAWHLNQNIFPPLNMPTIIEVLKVCEKLNAGELNEDDELKNGITVSEMLLDLKIETTEN